MLIILNVTLLLLKIILAHFYLSIFFSRNDLQNYLFILRLIFHYLYVEKCEN